MSNSWACFAECSNNEQKKKPTRISRRICFMLTIFRPLMYPLGMSRGILVKLISRWNYFFWHHKYYFCYVVKIKSTKILYIYFYWAFFGRVFERDSLIWFCTLFYVFDHCMCNVLLNILSSFSAKSRHRLATCNALNYVLALLSPLYLS